MPQSPPVSASTLRIVFAGTPEFAQVILQSLLDAPGCELVAAYTRPDRPAGRGRRLQPSPVKACAFARGIPVFQPLSLKDAAAQQELATLAPDVMIVAAYGLILPPAVLAIPRHGCINVHASVLPRWRGAAPVERAIEAGDTVSGVTIMQMDAGLDTGAMLLVCQCPVLTSDTGATLRERLGALGAEAVREALGLLRAGRLEPVVQDDALATYAGKLRREEAGIDWRLDAAVIARRVRAFNPANVCQTTVDGQALRVWLAEPAGNGSAAAPGTILRSDRHGILVACGTGAVLLTRLQLAGGKVMDAQALLNGRGELFHPGSLLGSVEAT
jgi:methionyl-tRNA formyltransferase